MRRLIWVLGVLALLWSFCWALASLFIKETVADWLVDRRTEGWEVLVSDFGLGGYPLWFEAGAGPVSLVDPTGAIGVSSGAISLWVPTWWPGYATLTLPGERLAVSTADLTLELAAEDAKAGVRIRPGTALELESLVLESGPWDLQTPDGRLLAGSDVHAHFVQDQDDPAHYAFDADLTGLAPGGGLRTRLGIPQDWPYQLSASTVSGSLRFAAPLNRAALDASLPPLRRVEIGGTRVVWGPVEALAEGVLDIDETGTPQGDIRLFVGNWRPLFEIAKASTPDVPAQADLILNALANIGGDPETLDVMLSFDAGQMSLSGIALGPAPRISWD